MDKEKFIQAQNQLKSRWAQADREEEDATINALLEHRHGRKFLWMLLQWGKFGQQPFTGNALTTSFNAGEANFGLRLWARLVEVNPAGLMRMMQESANEHAERTEQLANADGAGPQPDLFGDEIGRDPLDY